MANIERAADETLAAADAALVAAQEAMPRPYLGMSALGHPCTRRLWYEFRWSLRRSFDAVTLKRFEDGHRGEAVQAGRLRMVRGIELHTHRPDGSQYGFTLCGGHVRGHMDGAILGLLEAPKTWHVWEHKQVGEAGFRELSRLRERVGEKVALREWNEVYYGQAQLYMRCSGMNRHYLTCATPGGRSTLSVRTEVDTAFADRLIARATRIVEAVEPPERLSDRPDWFVCKLCDYHPVCHGTAAPLPTCRSCAHATPVVQDGQWHCGRHGITLTIASQAQGCQGQRYIPALLAGWSEAIDADTERNVVRYRNTLTGAEFENGLPPDGYVSAEIHACEDKRAIGEPTVQALRVEFDGRVAA